MASRVTDDQILHISSNCRIAGRRDTAKFYSLLIFLVYHRPPACEHSSFLSPPSSTRPVTWCAEHHDLLTTTGLIEMLGAQSVTDLNIGSQHLPNAGIAQNVPSCHVIVQTIPDLDLALLTICQIQSAETRSWPNVATQPALERVRERSIIQLFQFSNLGCLTGSRRPASPIRNPGRTKSAPDSP